MTSLNIRKKNNNEFILKGELTYTSIDKNTINSIAFPEAAGKIILDLSQITKTDSAGLALLVEWKKAALHHHFLLQLENLPEQILMLARLNGVENLFVSKVPEQSLSPLAT
jgi:phospholipid transport system transporter-binding protein